MAQTLTATHDLADVGERPNSGRRIGFATAAIILLFVAVAARWQSFGNPLLHVDEDFYLFVGGRMLHGAIPYVDLFDRKPIGLFLIFEVARLFSGNGVLPYQLMALASVWATSLILFRIAKRIASPGAALAAAALYPLCLNAAEGVGGQAPIFYNLPVAAAIAIIFFARDRVTARAGNLRLAGLAAMLLFGIALQIKYSAVFEGMFAGIMLLWLSWRNGRSLPALALDAMLWVGAALLPTLLAAGYYAAIGHLQAWVFANATSVLTRGQELPATVRVRVRTLTLEILPLLLALPIRRWSGCRPMDPAVRDDLRFLDGWAAAALLGVVLFGTWFNHYVLPLYAPFAVIVAPLGAKRWGRVYFIALFLFAAIYGQIIVRKHIRHRGDAVMLHAATKVLNRSHGCIFVYANLPTMYDSTNSCLLTRYPFGSHLWQRNEMGATGVDGPAEVARVMALRPDRVVSQEPFYVEENAVSREALYSVLRKDYVPIYRYGDKGRVALHYVIYALKPGIPSKAASGQVTGPPPEQPPL